MRKNTVGNIDFLIAIGLFGLLGAIGHLIFAAANLNVDPEGLHKRSDIGKLETDFFQGGYTIPVYRVQFDGDSNGCYRFDSLRNLKILIVTAVVGGGLLIVFDMSFSHQISDEIGYWLGVAWAAIKFRFGELGLL